MDAKTEQRLQTERNIWLATNRADGRPHLVPVWFVWWNGRFYLGIQSGSVKALNLAHNPKVSLALEDGVRVVICEGTAVTVPPPLDPQPSTSFSRPSTIGTWPPTTTTICSSRSRPTNG
jgi:pyridoxine/pyridoxamine 5'-phosphate oxidase